MILLGSNYISSLRDGKEDKGVNMKLKIGDKSKDEILFNDKTLSF